MQYFAMTFVPVLPAGLVFVVVVVELLLLDLSAVDVEAVGGH